MWVKCWRGVAWVGYILALPGLSLVGLADRMGAFREGPGK